MENYKVTWTERIGAPAARVYDIISDYHHGHPRILPPQFRNLVVEEGGRGAGTLTRFEMRSFGQTLKFRHEVLEPEPGRVLVERDRDDHDVRTTFTVDPIGGGESQVTILSELKSRPGLAGRLERWLSRRYLTKVYRQELAKLDALARNGRAA